MVYLVVRQNVLWFSQSVTDLFTALQSKVRKKEKPKVPSCQKLIRPKCNSNYVFFQRLSKEKSVTRSDSSSDISVLSNPSEASIEVIRPEVSQDAGHLQPPSAEVMTSAVSPIHPGHELQVDVMMML